MSQWTTHGGFCDNQPLVESVDLLDGMYAQIALAHPKWWRYLAAWNYIAKARDPGVAVTGTAYNGFTPPATKNRDWSSLDRSINRILAIVGCDIMLNVGQGRPGYVSTASVAADYAAFCVEVVQRYKIGGSGIAPINAGKGCTAIEVFNEENVSALWGKSVNPADYTSYVKDAYTAVKAVAPSMKVIFGGTQHVRRLTTSYYGDGWVTEQEIDFYTRALDALATLGNFVDAFAIHPYTTADADYTGLAPDDSDDAWQQADLIHSLLVARGFPSVPMMITEVGWPTNIVTEQQQSDYHQTAMTMWAARPWITDYIIYSAWDRTSSRIEKEKYYGCVHRDLTPKPLLTWLKSQVGATMTPPLMELTMTMGQPTLAQAATPPVMDFPLTMFQPVIGASAGPPVMDFPLTMPTPTIAATVALTAPLMSFPLTMLAPAVKTSVTYTFSGSTKPAGLIEGGQNGTSFVQFGDLQESNSVSGTNGTWYSWALWPNRLSTALVSVKTQVGNATVATNRGSGAALFADTTHGVLAPVVGLSASSGAQIISVVGSTLTPQAQDTGIVATPDDYVEIRTNISGGIVTYWMWINGVSTGLMWADSAGIITVPTSGWLWGGSFLRRRTSGVEYKSPGIESWAAQDL